MKHFEVKDFACQCGCGQIPQTHLLELADQVREDWGKPLNVSSGARCLKHTMHLRATGTPAALQSAHISGEAVDLIPVDKATLPAFQTFCKDHLLTWGAWMEAPESTPAWVHLQVRPVRNRVFKP